MTPAHSDPLALTWRPFPVDALPEPLRHFTTEASTAIGCDPTFVAMPLMAAVAAAIGSARTLVLKPGWFAPSILWTAVVAESGSAKSPAHRVALSAMMQRQRKALAQQAEANRHYEIELQGYERDLAAWKRLKDTTEPPPTKPPEPTAERCLVSDSTVEALAPILEHNPRGLLLACDELACWFNGFGAYKSGRGGDLQNWLRLFDGAMLLVDRKTTRQGGPQTICVPHSYCSVTGGIQPGVLRRALGNQELRDSGFLARLLLVMPPRQPKRWTDNGLDPATEAELARLVERLYELQPEVSDDGGPRPVAVRLATDAKAAWVDFYRQHNAEQVDLTGDLAAGWSKLEQIPARLALVIHYTRWVADDVKAADKVDGDTMGAAIRLAEWFKHETRRVYALLDESDDDRERRELVELVQRKGGRLTARELARASRRYALAADATAALTGLVKAGLGRWEEVPTSDSGGRPTHVFRLFPSADAAKTSPNTAEKGVVSTSAHNNAPKHAPADWREV